MIWLFPFSAQRTVVQALIMLRVDYGNVLYLGADKASIKRLQVIQNSVASMLYRIPKSASACCLLRELHWLTVEKRIYLKILCYMHKARAGVGPQYLNEFVKADQCSRTLRSSEHFLVRCPFN